jgi:hypothetical protein
METSHEWFVQKMQLEEKYSNADFGKSIFEVLDKQITNAKKLIEKEYEKYYESSKKGKPFKERVVYEDRIEKLKKYITERETDKKRSIPELKDFLKWGDYEKIESMGFTKFVEFYF